MSIIGLLGVNYRLVHSCRYQIVRRICSAQVLSAVPNAEITNREKKIVIPKRIKRDELSILKVLSSTVKRDPNASRYQYMDDPFLTPMSAYDKKSFSLAQASGQKAAQYVIKRYPGNFAYDASDPKIEAFQPPTGFVFGDDTLEGLQERIDYRLPIAAYESYNKIASAGVDIPIELTQDVLDLLCMYNSEDKPEALLAEELYYWRDTEGATGPGTNKPKRRTRNTWKSGGGAETLFKQIPEPTAEMYSSLIRGRAKYMDAQNAYELFKEARSKEMKLNVETYNAIISVSSNLSDVAGSRWEDLKDILSDMAACDVKPDVETFNTALYAVSRSSKHKDAREWVMSLLNEMRELNIEPTLTTWFHVLKTFYFVNEMRSNIMYDILDHLKGKEFMLTAPSDFEFFSFAMIKCWENVKDMELGHKLNDLLNTGNNIKLLGDNFKENLYHTHYMRLLATFEPIDVMMKHYEQIVPHIYTPTFGILSDVLNAIELNEAHEYIPRIWNDMVLLRYVRRADLLESFLLVMLKVKPENDPEIKKIYCSITDHIIRLCEADAQDPKVNNPLMPSGKALGSIVSIQLWAGNFEAAWRALEMYLENRNKINGFPTESTLVELTEECLKRKDLKKTMQVLTLMSDFSYPKLESLVEQIKNSSNPSDEIRRKLDDLL